MPRLSAVGISSLQAGEDVNWKDSALPVELEPRNRCRTSRRHAATQKDLDQHYYRSNQEQQDQRATADTLEQPNIFRFSRHCRTP